MKSVTQMSAAKQVLLNRYLRGAGPVDVAAVRPRPRAVVAPLSPTQEELYWRELRAAANAPLYNECITIRLPGNLQPAVLERAFHEIVRRHEIWRTTFETTAGTPAQYVQPFQATEFDTLNLADVPQHEREDEAVRIISDKIRRPFQLNRGPLLRPTLVRMAESEHRLYLVAHQIILDGMSAYRIFPSELALLYQAFLNGKSSPLPDLPIQYADFAYWQRESGSNQLRKQIEYWLNLLQSTPRPMRSAPQESGSPTKRYGGRIVRFAFSEQTSYGIKLLSRLLDSTEFLVLLSGLASVLNRTNREASVRIGTLSPSGRKRTEVMGLLGYFLNPVTLTFDFSSAPSFGNLVGQAQAAITEAIANDDVPIEQLARELNCDDLDSPNPFFMVTTSLQPPQSELPFDWHVTTMDVDNGASPWKLYIAFIRTAGTIIGRAQFNPDIFPPSTVDAIVRDLQTTLDEACSQFLAGTAPFRRS